jgi:hypothetical protein
MSIYFKIFDQDLHKPKDNAKTPLWIETPAHPDFLPCIVSSTRLGKFLVSKKLTPDSKLRSGVFVHEDANYDDLLRPIFDLAYDLSRSQGWPNRFKSFAEAFDYIQDVSGSTSQPHTLLIPKDFSFTSEFNLSDDHVYKQICKISRADVSLPVFLSRPDFVGLSTSFHNGKCSVLVHNVKLGMSFVDFK